MAMRTDIKVGCKLKCYGLIRTFVERMLIPAMRSCAFCKLDHGHHIAYTDTLTVQLNICLRYVMCVSNVIFVMT